MKNTLTSVSILTQVSILPNNSPLRYKHKTNPTLPNPDLTSLFNWNTKQLFLYVGAGFTSADGTQNEIVIWDRVVRRKEDAIIKVSSKSKYVLRDMARTFE